MSGPAGLLPQAPSLSAHSCPCQGHLHVGNCSSALRVLVSLHSNPLGKYYDRYPILLGTFLVKYHKEEIQKKEKMWPCLQESSIQREKREMCPHNTDRENSQVLFIPQFFVPDHILWIHWCLCQMRKLRLTKVTQNRDVHATFIPVAQRLTHPHEANTG